MSAENSNGNGNGNGAAASLFQRAHQKMVLLQRIDEQLVQLMDQRRKAQDELRGLQAAINGEFDRVTQAASELPQALAAAAAQPPAPEVQIHARTNGRRGHSPDTAEVAA